MGEMDRARSSGSELRGQSEEGQTSEKVWGQTKSLEEKEWIKVTGTVRMEA